MEDKILKLLGSLLLISFGFYMTKPKSARQLIKVGVAAKGLKPHITKTTLWAAKGTGFIMLFIGIVLLIGVLLGE